MKLIWNVFLYDRNRKEVKPWNVFEHGRFGVDMIDCLRDCRDKDEFKTELKRDVMYYFGFKVEYETFITEPFPYVTKKEIDRLAEEDVRHCTYVELEHGEKIDVYRQIMMNYDHFINYLWNNRAKILEVDKDA